MASTTAVLMVGAKARCSVERMAVQSVVTRVVMRVVTRAASRADRKAHWWAAWTASPMAGQKAVYWVSRKVGYLAVH